MMFNFWILNLISIFILPRREELQAHTIDGQAQGTTYHIKYLARDSAVLKSQVDSILHAIDLSLSLYNKSSLICRFNESKYGITMDEHFEKVIKASLDAWHKSNGISDITVKPLVDLWGFGVKGKQPLPDSTVLNTALQCVGSKWIEAKGNRLIKKMPCVQIDCNGIAQGYSVDVLAAFFEHRHINRYIIELGGEIRVKGKNEKGEAWTIGVESPGAVDFPGEAFEKLISMEAGAITTSGSYRKFFESGTKQYSHIIDPRTGYPAQTNLVSVSVLAANATIADAYDNVLMVLGLNPSFRFLEKHKDMEAFFIYKREDGTIADTATAGFYKYFRR